MPVFSSSVFTATLVASTPYSALEIKTPAGSGIRILKWWVELNSTTSTDKFVQVAVGQFTAAVTTNSATIPSLVDYGQGSLASQCTVGVNATVEGAGGPMSGYERHQVAPNVGIVVWEPREMGQQVPANSFWRIRLTPGSALTTTIAAVGATWEE